MNVSEDRFPDRVASAIEQGGGIKAMAEKTGFSPAVLRKWVTGESDPSRARLVALANAAEVGVEWLATGAGGDSPVVVSPNPEVPEGFVLLPRYDVRASLGAGTLVDSEQIVDHLAFKEDWIRLRLRRNPADLVLIEASGDSMDPTIRHGDLLLLDIGQPELRDNAIYALQINGGLIVKRIQRLLRGGVVVRSDNDRYEDEELSDDAAASLKVVGQVIWHGGIV